MDIWISLLSIIAFSTLFLVGLGCGVRLLTHWRTYRCAGKHHRRWQLFWFAGWMLILVALLALLLPATRSTLPFIAFFASPLWLIAYIEFRKARAQEAVLQFRYDELQEGVWPPPPINPPSA